MTYAPRSRTARATGSYANIGLESEVLGASPERLISLLFRGALTATAQARFHTANGRIAQRGQAISKAIDIVDSGLKASVDPERGGDVARHLIAAYELILRDLADAWHTAADPQFEQTPAS